MSALDAPAAKRRLTVTATSVPKLARGARMRFDETRQRWVVLVPERVLAPDDIAVEVLKLCDGVRSVTDIAEHLAGVYVAPVAEIMADVVEMLQGLAESGFVVEGRPA